MDGRHHALRLRDARRRRPGHAAHVPWWRFAPRLREQKLSLAILAVLLAGTAYEVAFALGALHVGRSPGDGPAGETPVVALSVAAMLGALCVALANGAVPRRHRPVAALLLAAAAFVVARFYTPDPYYAPSVRRVSDGGLFPATWTYAWVAAAVAAAVLSVRFRRGGSFTAAAVLLVLSLTAWAAASGH